MGYKKTATRFATHVRIDPRAKDWLAEHKDTRTIAGYLDKIINEHIEQYENHRRTKGITGEETND